MFPLVGDVTTQFRRKYLSKYKIHYMYYVYIPTYKCIHTYVFVQRIPKRELRIHMVMYSLLHLYRTTLLDVIVAIYCYLM